MDIKLSWYWHDFGIIIFFDSQEAKFINKKFFFKNGDLKPISLTSKMGAISHVVIVQSISEKTQEPGIKLQKADRNNTWTSPQTNAKELPKIPLVHFFYFKMAATT